MTKLIFVTLKLYFFHIYTFTKKQFLIPIEAVEKLYL